MGLASDGAGLECGTKYKEMVLILMWNQVVALKLKFKVFHVYPHNKQIRISIITNYRCLRIGLSNSFVVVV